MVNTRSHGSTSHVPPAHTSRLAGPSVLAEMERMYSDMMTEAQNQIFTKVEVLRYEIESLRKHLLPLITNLDSRLAP